MPWCICVQGSYWKTERAPEKKWKNIDAALMWTLAYYFYASYFGRCYVYSYICASSMTVKIQTADTDTFLPNFWHAEQLMLDFPDSPTTTNMLWQCCTQIMLTSRARAKLHKIIHEHNPNWGKIPGLYVQATRPIWYLPERKASCSQKQDKCYMVSYWTMSVSVRTVLQKPRCYLLE
jgi:hypothetical protein